MKKVNIKFKERIKEERENLGLNQVELAQKLNIGQSTVSKWESGTHEPELEVLVKLALFFNVTIDYLVGLED